MGSRLLRGYGAGILLILGSPELAFGDPLNAQVVAVGANSGTRLRILDTLSSGAQNFSTFWVNDGNPATAWFTLDLGEVRSVDGLSIAPRGDVSYRLNITFGNSSTRGKATGGPTFNCTTPGTDLRVPTELHGCATPGALGRYVTVKPMDRDYFRVHGVEVSGGTGTSEGPITFEDVTVMAGVQHSGLTWGSAWCDIDGNGFPDIWTSNHNTPDHLYRNFAGIFVLEVQPVIAKDTHGVTCADFDNDGDQDVFVMSGGDNDGTTGSGQPNLLYRNDDGQLFEVANEYGVDNPVARGRGSFWFDKDSDGMLDLALLNAAKSDGTFPSQLYYGNSGSFTPGPVVERSLTLFSGALIRMVNTSYVVFSSEQYQPTGPSVVFRYGPDSFVRTPGLPGWGATIDRARHVLIADLDNDLDEDLYLCRKTYGSQVWEQRSGTLYFKKKDPNCTAIAARDFDNDGDLDLWLTTSAVTAAIADYDRDGRLDVFETKYAGVAQPNVHRLHRNVTRNDSKRLGKASGFSENGS